MEWTNYGHDRNALEALYNNSTYFKESYGYNYEHSYEWASVFTSPVNHTVRYNFRSIVSYGLVDSTVSNYIIPVNNDVAFTEAVAKNDIEIYGFRDVTTPSHYLFNTIGKEGGEYFCLHSGVDYTGSSFCAINSSTIATTVDISDLISAYNAANTSYGDKYVIQPLIALDKKTPFYMIAGNTTILEPGTTVLVQDKKFMIVANGICVETE